MIDTSKPMLQMWVDDILGQISADSLWMIGEESLLSDEDKESLLLIFDGINHDSFMVKAKFTVEIIRYYVTEVLGPYVENKDIPSLKQFCSDKDLKIPALFQYMFNPRVAERIREFLCGWIVISDDELSKDHEFSEDDKNTLRKIYEDSLLGEVNDISNMLKADVQGVLKNMKSEPYSKIKRQLDGFKNALDRLSPDAKIILHAKARRNGFSIYNEECSGGYLIANWLSKCLSDPTPLDELFFYSGSTSRQMAISSVVILFYSSDMDLDGSRSGDLHEVFKIITRASGVDYDVHQMTLDAVKYINDGN